MHKMCNQRRLIGALCALPLAFSVSISAADNGVQGTDVLAIINDQNLTVQDFQAYVKMRLKNSKQKDLDQNQRQQIFGEYINRELLYQTALDNGLDKHPLVKAEIENQQHNILASYALQQITSQPITEDEMKKIYTESFSQPIKEYKTRHILLKTEAEAQDIISQLEKGKNFMQLASTSSIDASGKNGGELPWTSDQAMLKPFSSAVMQLANGKYTTTPVQTQFGWHVIKLDGTRETPPPDFDKMKQRIASIINNRRITAFISALRTRADIQIKAGQSQQAAAKQ